MNRYYPHPIIAQEGWAFIIGGVVVSVIVMLLGGWWSLPFWLGTLFMLNFFRDPARNIPEAPDAILSPADGRVVVVEKAIDPYRNTDALKISVFMNVFDVHSQRAPVRGKITDVRYISGSKINASLDKASSENERNAVLMTTASGREITFVQIAGLVARRILCYVNKGDTLVRGERYGFIRFGSRVDVYLPLDAIANVAIGDKVRATETILAFLPLELDPNFDSSKVTIASKYANSTAARLKADKAEQAKQNQQDNLDVQIHARMAAEFAQQSSELASYHNIAAEESEVAARLAKIQAERQAEAQAESVERARILAREEAKAVHQRLAQEQAAEQARLQAEQAVKAEAQRVAREQAAKAEAERIAREQAAKAEAERIAREQAAKAEAERIAREQAAKAEAERIAREQAAKAEAERIAREQAAKAEAERIAREQAAKAEAERVAREQAAKAEAERVAREQAAKAEAERVAREQAAKAEAERIAKEEAAERARILAEEEAEAEAVRQRLAMEAAEEAARRARLSAEKFRPSVEEKPAHDANSFRQAEEKALAEIAAREPIVRRESFAAVPEPWQTVEPREVVIKVEK